MKPKKQEAKPTKILVRLTPEQREGLDRLYEEHGTSAAWAIRRALDEYLAKELR